VPMQLPPLSSFSISKCAVTSCCCVPRCMAVSPGVSRAEQQQSGQPEHASVIGATLQSADDLRDADSARRASVMNDGAPKRRQGSSPQSIVLDSPESPNAQGVPLIM